MTVENILSNRNHELTGRLLTLDEFDKIDRGFLSSIPNWLIQSMKRFRLIGSKFSLLEEADLSGLGVEMQWMSPADMQSEMVDFYPGIAIVNLGYIAIGDCLKGSGDSYYLRGIEDQNPALVRIYHDSLDKDLKLIGHYEDVVSPSLSMFLESAKID